MSVKKWLRYTLVMILSTLALIACINYYIDPLWIFESRNDLNSDQYNIDERQLKINKLFFSPDPSIDTLLLGSSRVTYIDQNSFTGYKVYNLSQDNQYPFELNGMIETAKKIQGKPFKYIVIGFDFIGSSKGKWIQKNISERPSQKIYLQKAQQVTYRFKTLLSYDTLKYSIKNIQLHYDNNKHIVYNRDNVKYMYPYSPEKKEDVLKKETDYLAKNHYGTYVYDENISNIYEELKKNNPDSKFIIFTTPVTSNLYKLNNELGLQDDYKKWLKELVASFGNVYDFTGINSVTVNPENYRDVHHFDPRIGQLLVDRITGVHNQEIPNDFGVLLTVENINGYLKNINIRDSKQPVKYKLD